MRSFEKITREFSEYRLAQAQLASLYLSKNPEHWLSNDAEGLSLDTNMPNGQYAALEQSLISASHAQDYNLMSLSTNFLCGFNPDEFMTAEDYPTSNPDDYDSDDNKQKAYTALFKLCHKIREQQEEIRILKSRLAAVSAPLATTVPLMSPSCSSTSTNIASSMLVRDVPAVILSTTPASPNAKAKQETADAALAEQLRYQEEQHALHFHVRRPSEDISH